MKIKELKIVSNGTVSGTKIYADDKQMGGVQEFSISVDTEAVVIGCRQIPEPETSSDSAEVNFEFEKNEVDGEMRYLKVRECALTMLKQGKSFSSVLDDASAYVESIRQMGRLTEELFILFQSDARKILPGEVFVIGEPERISSIPERKDFTAADAQELMGRLMGEGMVVASVKELPPPRFHLYGISEYELTQEQLRDAVCRMGQELDKLRSENSVLACDRRNLLSEVNKK